MKIKIDSEKHRFKEHLSIQNNNHILFSGRFGTGKTYFLNDFFKAETEYTSINISPVNYSISSNSDILNYIKYDIIFELLKYDLSYEYDKIPLKITSENYILNNLTSLISNILKNFGKLGKNTSSIIDSLSNFYSEIKKHQEKFIVDDKKELIEFLEEVSIKEGSIYLEDNITLIISCLLEQLQKPILIIDDLDRLDPNHIFRILNVFATHLNVESDLSNKFGFLKIIFVCDIQNIKKIFKTFYGIETDFNGYIDKFYSKTVFHFDNKKEVINNLSKIFSSVEKTNNSAIFQEHLQPRKVFKKLLSELIESDSINLRSLLKFTGYSYESLSKSIIITSVYKNSSSVKNYYIIEIFHFLSEILGSKSNLEDAISSHLKNVKNKTIYVEGNNYEISPYIFLIDYKGHKEQIGKHIYKNTELNIIADYTISQNGYQIGIQEVMFKKLNGEELEFLPFPKILKLAFNIYSEIEFV